MRRADSLGKTLMLEKAEGKSKRGQQRIRWLDNVTNSMDMSLSQLQEIVEGRGAWWVAVNGVVKSWTWLSNWMTTTSIYPSIHLSIYPSIHLSIYLSVYLSSVDLSIYLLISLPVCLSIYLPSVIHNRVVSEMFPIVLEIVSEVQWFPDVQISPSGDWGV